MFEIYRKLKWAYQKFRVSYSLPFIILVSYTLLGAVIFRNVELEEDVKRRADYRNSTEFAFNQVLKKIISIKCGNTITKRDTIAGDDHELATRHAKEALFWFIDYLNLTQIIEERSSNTPWTWMGSAFYSGQLYTTIGYGYPLVHTSTGQVVTIFYIMIGIPIFLIILKDVGKLLSRALRKIYKRWRTAKNKLPDNAVRRMSEPVKAIYSLTGVGNSTSTKSPTDPPTSPVDLESPTQLKENIIEPIMINEEKQNEVNQKLQSGYANFPIPLALFILVAWITLSAALFCVWETEWGYLTSVYFFFVSISTVGLGDIVPSKPDMMLVNFVLILIGLALLSMCINLIQDAIEKVIEQLLQEYIEEIEKIAAIVTTDTEFVEETATPFEIGMSADLLTAPLTAIREDQEPWFRGIPQKAKDWMAEKLVDKLIVQQLDPESSGSEDEDDEVEELEEIIVDGQRGMSPGKISSQKDTVSKVSKKKKKRLFRRRGNFSLNYNFPTLRTIQAMEKVKINTKSDNTFRGRLFAKFASNKKFNKYIDEHVVEPNYQMTNASVVGTIIGDPQKFNLENSPNSWKIKLVTPESTIPSIRGSTGTASTYDLDSLYSIAYNDVTFGYIKEILLVPPPLAEDDEPGIKIKVNRSSESPEPTCSYSPGSEALFEGHCSFRRSSSPGFFLSPEHSHNHDPRSKMPMMRCPSCLHMSTAPSAVLSRTQDCDIDAMKRVRDICGLLPGDFTPLDKRKPKSPSPSRSQLENSRYDDIPLISEVEDSEYSDLPSRSQREHSGRDNSLVRSQVEDSGYDNSLATDKSSLMTDSALMGTSMTASFLKSQLEDEDQKSFSS
ncbi:hypothetical protein FO519_005255 [Halicephalobus sp. NKZ332]|nr:hypothetical protein FO519_005255 [Halicephalobus sp. NKZ332]